MVSGARAAVRDRPRSGKVLGSVATLILVGVMVSVVAPAVVATNVPATSITSTPDTVGLEYESVMLTTADGVALAAWYVPGSNGAGVIVRHGAGSTRSSVLHEAAVLVSRGYSALLVDARGHGESGGDAMDFGWYGDLDIVAGVEFLAFAARGSPRAHRRRRLLDGW